MQASVALQGRESGPVFGSLEDIEQDILVVRAMYPWDSDDEVDFRLELTQRGAWVAGRLSVLSASEDDALTAPVARCQITWMSSSDRRQLAHWLEELSVGGTSTHPSRWVETLSQVSDVAAVRKRAAFNEALRKRVRKLRRDRADG